MRFMVIENNVATNAIEADSPSAVPGLTLVQSNTANIGDLWNGATWTPAPPKPVDPAPVRAERDRRLAECDWTQLPDAPLTAAQKAAWSAYRQALRDVPAQAGFPGSVVWPEVPK